MLIPEFPPDCHFFIKEGEEDIFVVKKVELEKINNIVIDKPAIHKYVIKDTIENAVDALNMIDSKSNVARMLSSVAVAYWMIKIYSLEKKKQKTKHAKKIISDWLKIINCIEQTEKKIKEKNNE